MIKRVLTLSAAAAALVALTACGSTSPSSTDSASTATSGPSTPAATSAAPTTPAAGQCSYPASGPAAKAVKAPSAIPIAGVKTATINTNRGTIAITLDPKHAPCTVNSLVSLIRQGYFDNTHCHRLTTSGIYVLQCGDPSGTGGGGPGYTFADELSAAAAPRGCTASSCIYPAGTVAMANTGQPGSNGSQFFLVYKDSPLAYSYTIFGQMSASGLKVVQQIASHGSGTSDAYGNTPPNETVTITKATAN
ncbi:MAG: peptidylprolyl isomerase [Marmoricola sp.]